MLSMGIIWASKMLTFVFHWYCHPQDGMVNPTVRKDMKGSQKLYCCPIEGCPRGPNRPFSQFSLVKQVSLFSNYLQSLYNYEVSLLWNLLQTRCNIEFICTQMPLFTATCWLILNTIFLWFISLFVPNPNPRLGNPLWSLTPSRKAETH